MKKDFIICIDMDDTIENLLEAWVAELNKRHNTNVDVNDIKDWDISLAFPTVEKDKLWEPLTEENFWKTVTPKKDAITYLDKLTADGFQIYICTNSHYTTLKYKLENVLFKYFPFIKSNQIIVTSNKQLINCDVLVDDYQKNLIGGKYEGILYHTYHNRYFDETKYENIKRLYNWKEIYDYIKILYEEKIYNA